MLSAFRARAGAFCLGVCGFALFLLLPTGLGAAPHQNAPAAAETGTIFVDEAMQAKSARKSGFAPYQTHPAILNGQMFPHSLMTEVSGANPADMLSVLTLKIDGKYERFRATVGRGDDEARTGPAYAYFEVWGDGTCFFRSTPIRSAATLVRIAPGAPNRKTPQTIDIIVRGTRTLQLVTRFAGMEQQAPDITRARGCVWGDPCLLTASALAAPLVAPASVPGRSTPLDPRREGVRMAVLLLASGVGRAASSDSSDGAAPIPLLTHYPLKIAVMPLRPWGKRGHKPADAAIQKLLEASLPTAKRGSEAVFTLADPETVQELSRHAPPSFAAAAELTDADIAPLTAVCREKAVDAVLCATLLPGARLELRLFHAAAGSRLSQSTQILSSARKN